MEDQKQNPVQAQQEWNPMLVFHITLADVRAILSALSAAPLGQSINAFPALSQEAERQVAVLKANAEKAAAPEKVDEPTATE